MTARVKTSNVSVITQKRRESFTRFDENTSTRQSSKTSILDRTKKSLVKFVPTTEDITDLKSEQEMDDHKIPLEEIYKIFKTDPDTGVTEEWAKYVQSRDGYNQLTPPKVTPFWIKLLRTMCAGFALALWAAGFLCFFAFFFDYQENEDYDMDNLYLGLILFGVVIISSIFTYVQERKSEKIMESFQKLIPHNTTVIREGQLKTIAVEELIVGDIVELKMGDRIPADIRIIWANNFKVDNSALTGESVPLTRTPEFTDDNPLETQNLIFFSTYAVEGSCRGVVTQCGDNTVMGRIAHLTTRVKTELSPIGKEIKNFVRIITIIASAIGGSFLIIAMFMGFSWLDAMIFCIGIIVANVPEGLLPTVTVCLTITAKQMAKRNCLVKHLEAVESLGSTSTICSDKTGTLTQNRMTVAHLWYDKKVVAVPTDENQTREDVNINKSSPTFNNLCMISGLCNKATFLPETMDQPILKREVRGDASEAALLKFTELVYGDVMKLRNKYHEEFLIPFTSVNKYQVSIHKMEAEHRLLIKGAPERILEFCSTVYIEGKVVPLDEEFKKAYKAVYENLGGQGERVLGFCDLPLPFSQFNHNYKFDNDKVQNIMKDLRFVGLIAMIDPPRSAVPDALRKCRTAGIKVIMVTGDHPITGKAIAQAVGIITSDVVDTSLTEPHIPLDQVYQRIQKMYSPDYAPRAIVIHGYHLRDITSDDLKIILSRHPEIVFARTSPQQKLLIVEGCQQLGSIVAVTGDGVNDSPALKKADIGVAMGIAGSDVSKQAADMILLDDNFASIITGIEEGRRIFDNLKKAIAYVLTSNVPEICPFLFFIILRMPLSLNTINILFVDLGTDILPTVTLGYEYAESDVMLRRPRDPRVDKLVSWGLIRRVILHGWIEVAACNFCFFVVCGQNGFLPDRLLGHRSEWINEALDDYTDSYGQEWTYHQRKELELTGNTASFVVIVETQIISLITCKTIVVSVFTHGFRNYFLNCGIVFTLCLLCFICYTPYISAAVKFRSVRWQWWLTAIPFNIYFLLFSETLKFLTRRYPGSVYDEFKM